MITGEKSNKKQSERYFDNQLIYRAGLSGVKKYE